MAAFEREPKTTALDAPMLTIPRFASWLPSDEFHDDLSANDACSAAPGAPLGGRFHDGAQWFEYDLGATPEAYVDPVDG